MEIHFARDPDGRWVAEIPDFTGAVGYGNNKTQARLAALAMAREIAMAEINDGEPDRQVLAFLARRGKRPTGGGRSVGFRSLQPT